MVNNVLKYQNDQAQNLYTDVTPIDNPWSYASIEALGETGVITGFPDGTFQPRSTMSRAEMTVLPTAIRRPTSAPGPGPL
jgi:hypothetical protein